MKPKNISVTQKASKTINLTFFDLCDDLVNFAFRFIRRIRYILVLKNTNPLVRIPVVICVGLSSGSNHLFQLRHTQFTVVVIGADSKDIVPLEAFKDIQHCFDLVSIRGDCSEERFIELSFTEKTTGC